MIDRIEIIDGRSDGFDLDSVFRREPLKNQIDRVGVSRLDEEDEQEVLAYHPSPVTVSDIDRPH